ncbi:YtxH domain-containing protein [Streptomyces telluris]|uniref:YtxH domain-containing protein n=1 Tax=Streptomyces telluris TaxID=2720021 RepID=A0A9X2LEU4_9ACTN|nr:YtxH domain-containing protein [Streptomyces telluris]MCQ8770012.1 YtxH domain-containing protein [Streptomyces telluris]NJP82938.1 YtxH domain-containing protein [Streptomyces telluris]
MRYRLTFMIGAAVGYVLGARAGRERYEQLRKGARQIAQNPAVRNTVESAAQNGRAMSSRAFAKVGDRLPDSVSERVRSLRERGQGGAEDDWGTSNT